MKLTPRIVAYIAHEEGLVREAYRDSVGVWTWALGVTGASGHQVYPRYLDKPQPLEKCVEVSVWLIRQRYLPRVELAFPGIDLAEHELAAALSFHWNTGAIGRADWVEHVLIGDRDAAREAILDYRRPPEIVPRRKRERALFFDAAWPADLRCPVWNVAKPSYRPRGSVPTDLLPIIAAVMGES